MKKIFRVCSKCGSPHYGNYIYDNDEYCRFCGQKFEFNTVSIDVSMIPMVYGPIPRRRRHVCENCYYSWETVLSRDKEQYCPECGKRAPIDYESDLTIREEQKGKEALAKANLHMEDELRKKGIDVDNLTPDELFEEKLKYANEKANRKV